MIHDLESISHALAALAFLGLLVLVLVSWRGGAIGAWLAVACAATVVWAAFVAYASSPPGWPRELIEVLEVVRSAGWIAFLLVLLSLPSPGRTISSGWIGTVAVVVAVCLITIGIAFVDARALASVLSGLDMDLALLGRLVLAVIGLLLIENLLRNTRPDHRWAIKFLCFGIGSLFAYDFFMYADALLFHRVSADLHAARGVTNAVIVPLIAVSARRSPGWSIDIFVSRRAVFHSATLIGAGTYLLFMAAVGFYLREFGGHWGAVLQVTFLFAAILMLVLVVFSGSFRARAKDVISKNFFRYKYDYRDEWLRFIDTIASAEHAVSLPQRVMEGIANIVESPEGALWACDGATHYTLLASWNLGAPEGAREADPSFARCLEANQTVIDVDVLAQKPDSYPGLVLPDWLGSIPRAWLVVPLLHHDRMLGFLLLGRPRAPRRMDKEDYTLLTTAGRQAASYLAEREVARTLAESQQFDEFNRRFAFVLHDVKNLVSQLSLMLQNAPKHKDNPAFQEDMLETVKESVDKMKRLLVRLHRSGKETAVTTRVPLDSVLSGVVEDGKHRNGSLSFDCGGENIAVVADEERLASVFAHLLDNALEAIDGQPDGRVAIRLSARGDEAVVEFEDNGPGMNEEFLRNDLFRPFRTTKDGGFGIGAYESRAFIQELGGRLDVTSEPGRGTMVRICLPMLVSREKV